MSLLKKVEEKKLAKIRAEKRKKATIATVGLGVGALVGAATGILAAPKSGKETREDIKEKSTKVKENLSNGIEDTKGKVKESRAKIKEYLNNKKAKNEDVEIIEVEDLRIEENTEVEETTEA